MLYAKLKICMYKFTSMCLVIFEFKSYLISRVTIHNGMNSKVTCYRESQYITEYSTRKLNDSCGIRNYWFINRLSVQRNLLFQEKTCSAARINSVVILVNLFRMVHAIRYVSEVIMLQHIA